MKSFPPSWHPHPNGYHFDMAYGKCYAWESFIIIIEAKWFSNLISKQCLYIVHHPKNWKLKKALETRPNLLHNWQALVDFLFMKLHILFCETNLWRLIVLCTSALNTVYNTKKTPNEKRFYVLLLWYFCSFCKNLKAFYWLIFISMRPNRTWSALRNEYDYKLLSVECHETSYATGIPRLFYTLFCAWRAKCETNA